MRWLLIVLAFAQNLNATVLIQGPGSPVLDYRAALKADPDLLSPSQVLARQRPLAASRETLLSAFGEAQAAFLENSKEEAVAKFEQVIALIHNDDWAKMDRMIFLNSFLRLAQLQTDVEKQNYWLAQATLTGPDLEPEAGLFPPPLVRAWKNLKTEIPRAAIPARLWDNGWNLILLNGFACTSQNCPGWPLVPGKTRVTLLSDQFQPYTTIVDVNELERLKLKFLTWASGECGNYQLSTAAAQLKSSKVFWSLSCEAPKSLAALNLNPSPVKADALPRLPIQEKSPAFYKSKWFWAGVTVVTAALVIAGSKQKQEKEPTTTYGY